MSIDTAAQAAQSAARTKAELDARPGPAPAAAVSGAQPAKAQPAADILEDMILPTADRIAETVRRALEA